MSAPVLKRLSSTATLLSLFGLLFLATAGALLCLPGPRSPLPGLGVAAMAVVAVLAIKRLVVRGRDTELALEEGERYIETVADLSQDIHAIIEARSRSFLYLNPAVTNLLGYTREDFLKGGMRFFTSLVHTGDLPLLRRHYEKLLPPPVPGQEETIQELTFRVRDQRGSYRWFKARTTVFVRLANGQPAEFLSVIHDVTEQRSYEAALLQAQRQESLGLLAGSALHDLGNTLMGIQGFTEIAMTGHGGPGQMQASLEKVLASTTRAMELCRQMVAMSAHGRLQVGPRQWNEVIQESLPAIESLVPHGSRLELELAKDLPQVNGDLNQMRYALLNLVYNAAEAVRVAPGQISIRTRVLELGEADGAGLDGPHVCLEVHDSGPGLPEEVAAQIFDPLFAAQWPGHGLGLSALQGIMREHRGGLRTTASPEQGASTQLFFPLAGEVPVPASGAEDAAAGAPGAILLVEDEPTIRAILRQGLEIDGFQVLEAGDGVDGLSAFLRHRTAISLVLLDLTMPRMGGEAVFEELHRLAPDLPVVLMSGYSEREATSALAHQGLAGFLSKPCSIKDAVAVVRAALGAALGAAQAGPPAGAPGEE